ncbi:MAG: hypothetical protein ACLRWQ_10985 [Flavonifractor plautii]
MPYEDCCTVFTPRHPRLRPMPGEVEVAEETLDIDGHGPGAPWTASSGSSWAERLCFRSRLASTISHLERVFTMSYTAELHRRGHGAFAGQHCQHRRPDALSRACRALGINVYYHTVVGDNPQRAPGRGGAGPEAGRTLSSPPAAWVPPATT